MITVLLHTTIGFITLLYHGERASEVLSICEQTLRILAIVIFGGTLLWGVKILSIAIARMLVSLVQVIMVLATLALVGYVMQLRHALDTVTKERRDHDKHESNAHRGPSCSHAAHPPPLSEDIIQEIQSFLQDVDAMCKEQDTMFQYLDTIMGTDAVRTRCEELRQTRLGLSIPTGGDACRLCGWLSGAGGLGATVGECTCRTRPGRQAGSVNGSLTSSSATIIG